MRHGLGIVSIFFVAILYSWYFSEPSCDCHRLHFGGTILCNSGTLEFSALIFCWLSFRKSVYWRLNLMYWTKRLTSAGISVLSRHLIQSDAVVGRRRDNKLNPKADHLSFLCRDMDLVRAALHENEIEYVEQVVMDDGIEQVCTVCFASLAMSNQQRTCRQSRTHEWNVWFSQSLSLGTIYFIRASCTRLFSVRMRQLHNVFVLSPTSAAMSWPFHVCFLWCFDSVILVLLLIVLLLRT